MRKTKKNEIKLDYRRVNNHVNLQWKETSRFGNWIKILSKYRSRDQMKIRYDRNEEYLANYSSMDFTKKEWFVSNFLFLLCTGKLCEKRYKTWKVQVRVVPNNKLLGI